MKRDPRDIMVTIYERLGLTRYALALLMAREERSIARYFAGETIPGTVGRWLQRIQSVTISEGHATIVFRMPARIVKRGRPTTASVSPSTVTRQEKGATS